MKNGIQKTFHNLFLVIALMVMVKSAFAQAPTITSFTPTSGSIGTLVTITGTNLNNLDTIKIGGVSAIKISAKTDTLVAMVMPGADTGNIYLANSGGNAVSGDSYTRLASMPPATQQGNKFLGSGSIGTNIYYGNSVCVSADGNTAIVGGYGNNSNQGAAWIYTRIDGTWNQQGNKLVGTGAIGVSYIGYSVSISADGNTAILGGYNDNNGIGAAWIFIRNGSIWSQQGNKLVGTGNTGESFQGVSVALSANGNTAIVGGQYDNISQGAAWVFIRNGAVWSQQGNKLVGTGNVGKANQGRSVSISADGNTVILGGWTDNSNQGAAWVFNRMGNIWSQQGSKLVGTGNVGEVNQGISVSLSADGNTAIVGGSSDNTRQGAAWLFTRIGGFWSQQGNKLVGTGSIGNAEQGSSVSLSADGNTAIIGGWIDSGNKGAIWVFARSGEVWSQQGIKRVGTGAIGKSYQGSSVSLSADGNTAIVGGNFDNSGQGAAWVFGMSTNANLNSLVLSSGSFNPVFSFGTYIYSTSVINDTVSTKVNSTKADSNATIQLRINGGVYSTVTSGVPSDSLILNVGSNIINVKVTSQFGTIKIYTINVNRNLIAPSNMSYSPDSIIALRTSTNINAIPVYLGDSITTFSISPSLPNGVSLNTSTGLISGISTVNLPQTLFTITGTNTGGSTTASFKLTVNPALSINKVNTNPFSNINIKPNPFTNEVEINFISTTKETTKLDIIDAIGKEVFSKNIQSNIGNNNIIIDEMTHLKSGIYFARLANNNGFSQSFKLVKE